MPLFNQIWKNDQKEKISRLFDITLEKKDVFILADECTDHKFTIRSCDSKSDIILRINTIQRLFIV
jgi:hypothetical protein